MRSAPQSGGRDRSHHGAGMSNIIELSAFKGAQSPQPSENGTKISRPRQAAEDPGETQPEELGLRDRACVKRGIEAHIEARRTYQAAVSWLAAAEAENLSIASIEAAREDTRKFHAEMVEAARSLIIVMPTDLKALCDLTMYLEKNFTILPTDVVVAGDFGGVPRVESFAFHLLRTVRLSLRHVAKYGKHGSML
ncbi:hypothetical protein [Bradyrhizobium sp. URHC0002]